MKKTLFSRFLVRYALISLAGLLILALVSIFFLREQEIRRESEYLRTRTRMIAELIADALSGEASLQEMNRQLRSISNLEGLNVYLLRSDDENIGGSSGHGRAGGRQHGVWEQFLQNDWLGAEIREMLSVEQLRLLVVDADEPTVLRTKYTSSLMPLLMSAQKTEVGLLFVYRSQSWLGDNIYNRLPSIYTVLLISFLFVGLISVSVMAMMYRKLLKPFREISAVAEGILEGRYDRRIDEYPEEELAIIGESVNRMVEKLEKLEITRTDYIAQLAHELRTPLTVLRISLQGILDDVIRPAEMPEFTRESLQELERLENLVNSLLDLSVIENSDFPLDIKAVDFTDLIRSVTDQVNPLCQTQEQDLAVDIENGMQGQADPERIRQVMLNLLGNSVKFAGPGKKIRLSAKIRGGTLQVCVWDNGPGIPQAEQAVLFEKYRRQGERAGAGLGLTVARAIIEAHGGSISVSSDGKSYSQFDWWIPT